MKKMTSREFYNSVIAILNNVDDENVVSLKEFAENAIVKLDERNAKRSSKPSKKALENEKLKEDVFNFLMENKGEKFTSTQIGQQFGFSFQKASVLCRDLVNNKRISEGEVRVPKRGKTTVYYIDEQ